MHRNVLQTQSTPRRKHPNKFAHGVKTFWHIRWKKRVVLAFLGIGLGAIGHAIFEGIIGNRSDALFLLLLEKTSRMPADTVWVGAIAFLTVLGYLPIFYIWRRNRQLSILKLHELELRLDELELDLDQRTLLLETADSLLRLTPSLISAQNLEDEIHRIVKKVLYRVTQSFTSNVYRGLLLLPDTNSEYLVIWSYYGFIDSIEEKKFYIGKSKSDIRRGVAGEAFIDQNITIAHISREESGFKCDRESYIFFGEKGTYPTHRSLVCVPIVIGPDTKDRLGVVCFDSKDEKAFDFRGTQEMLQLLSRQIAAALLIYQRCKSI